MTPVGMYRVSWDHGKSVSGVGSMLVSLVRTASTCLRTIPPSMSLMWYDSGPVTLTTVPGIQVGDEAEKSLVYTL